MSDKKDEVVQAVTVLKEVKMTDAEAVVGNYIVLWRNESKQPCKVLSVDKEKGEIRYQLLGGTDKGKTLKSRFDSSQTVNVYDEGNSIMACLDA